MNDDKLLFYEQKWLEASERLNHKSCQVFNWIMLASDHFASYGLWCIHKSFNASFVVDKTNLVVFHVWD